MSKQLKHKFNIGDVVQFSDEPDLGPHVVTAVSVQYLGSSGRIAGYYDVSQHFSGTIPSVDPEHLELAQVTPENEWRVKPILEAFARAATHCWNCEEELGHDWPEKCPECGRATIF